MILLAAVAGTVIDGLAHDSGIAEQATWYLAVFAIVIDADSVGQCLSSYDNGSGDTRLPL